MNMMDCRAPRGDLYSEMNTKTPKGFTIVELLIVIVVIAILAAIMIVTFNGIQNRAKLAQYQSDVTTIVKKTELYPHASGTGLYPLASAGPDATTVTAQTGAGALLTAAINLVTESKLPPSIVIFGVMTAAGAPPTNTQALVAANASTAARGYFVKYCATGKGMYIYYPDPIALASADAPVRTVGVCP
jgi:prepilin-type N-terminal cleavage/methylation domain-containing protein